MAKRAKTGRATARQKGRKSGSSAGGDDDLFWRDVKINDTATTLIDALRPMCVNGHYPYQPPAVDAKTFVHFNPAKPPTEAYKAKYKEKWPGLVRLRALA